MRSSPQPAAPWPEPGSSATIAISTQEAGTYVLWAHRDATNTVIAHSEAPDNVNVHVPLVVNPDGQHDRLVESVFMLRPYGFYVQNLVALQRLKHEKLLASLKDWKEMEGKFSATLLQATTRSIDWVRTHVIPFAAPSLYVQAARTQQELGEHRTYAKNMQNLLDEVYGRIRELRAGSGNPLGEDPVLRQYAEHLCDVIFEHNRLVEVCDKILRAQQQINACVGFAA